MMMMMMIGPVVPLALPRINDLTGRAAGLQV